MSADGIGLDVRWPIGLLFSAMGAALAIFGAFFANGQKVWRIWIDLDLWWGLVMLVFGLAMIWAASRASHHE
jgi:hypothetical protein